MAKPEQNQTPEDDMAAQLLLKEVDESINQEKLQAIWDEWGATIIGVACMIVFGTMVGVGWQSWRASVHEDQTAKLLVAQTSSDFDNNLSELSGDYKGMAAMMKAGALASENGNDAAINELMIQAKESGMQRPWNYMAEWNALRSATASPDANQLDIAASMVELADKRRNPFAPAILMEAGLLYAQNGETEAAINILNQAKSHEFSENAPILQDQIDRFITLYKPAKPLSKDTSS